MSTLCAREGLAPPLRRHAGRQALRQAQGKQALRRAQDRQFSGLEAPAIRGPPTNPSASEWMPGVSSFFLSNRGIVESLASGNQVSSPFAGNPQRAGEAKIAPSLTSTHCSVRTESGKGEDGGELFVVQRTPGL
jgi:hypothetical protein